ncbi:MAG: hypothetical protein KDA65_02245 [Planctomycetaceae bacterium]|nr:hypothetical protein [Planctomycetaceae bacterium]
MMNEISAEQVVEVFETELERQAWLFSRTSNGDYSFDVDGVEYSVSPDNLIRDCIRDGNLDRISDFIATIQDTISSNSSNWIDVRALVRYLLLSGDAGEEFDDVIVENVSPDLCRVFVFTNADRSSISWITKEMISVWQIDLDEVVQVAEQNMNELVTADILEVENVGGVPLGLLNTIESSFKASLVLAPDFRNVVRPVLGWPVYAVLPAQDFVYLIPTEHRSFLGRLGPVVLREYEESGYPISKDVFEISDAGIQAIGTLGPQR